MRLLSRTIMLTSALAIILSSTILSTAVSNASITDGDKNSTTNNINTDQRATWVVDPSNPGPNLPPIGRSLFDYFITVEKDGKRIYDIPFPYSRLIHRLDSLVQADSINDSSDKNNPTSRSAVKQVLFPLGRSLARNISRPDFFKYPRVVSVVDTQPRPDSQNNGAFLKDKIYIGYGESANILEVISYNEAAARFEFQIVTDYKANGKPQVFYASREVCSACHQNGALIFSRQQWDETNANPKIAELLRQENREFYGIDINRGVDVPFAIDTATDRANYYSLYQLLWQQGCKTNSGSKDSSSKENSSRKEAQCRADLFKYALQYALSGNSSFDKNSKHYQDVLLKFLLPNWKQRWPQGLLIPDPDIPNRDPLLLHAKYNSMSSVDDNFSDQASDTLNTMLSKNDVPSEFEPLNPRPPLSLFKPGDADNVELLIRGLTEFIAETDIIKIDQHIKLKATIGERINKTHPLNCQYKASKSHQKTQQIKINCASSNSEHKLSLRGQFTIKNVEFIAGSIDQLNSNGDTYFDLKLSTSQIHSAKNNYTANLQLTNHKLNFRLPTGNSFSKLTISWPKQLNRSKGKSNKTYKASITELRDFSIITEAIDKMLIETLQSDDIFSDKPFRRAKLMASLSTHLALPSANWCCLDDTNMPTASLAPDDDRNSVVSQTANPGLALFYRYCSICHRTAQPFPPNFLHGNQEQVTANVSHCAQRIFFRLSMWQIDESHRAKSPMPPYTALSRLEIRQDLWPQSDELSALKHYVKKILKQQSGKSVNIEEYNKTGFDNLRECLPN